ncbi:hypothetical protein BDY21DRAFT_68288 [Lineolata rhizophorae]|uniref:Uncharacterized protein n=1 Tax=Lineolata rhizophorae TaxID=578093 RepID=A0A6A6NVJ0_9PEZI|nr:hypothetical protein BDY21DRAFT_68288 [Lineolata rhizophorae]
MCGREPDVGEKRAVGRALDGDLRSGAARLAEDQRSCSTFDARDAVFLPLATPATNDVSWRGGAVTRRRHRRPGSSCASAAPLQFPNRTENGQRYHGSMHDAGSHGARLEEFQLYNANRRTCYRLIMLLFITAYERILHNALTGSASLSVCLHSIKKRCS